LTYETRDIIIFVKKQKIPKRLQAILWSADIHSLDLDRNKNYIIHQILRFGTIADIKWLFTTYSKEEIYDVFLHQPSKNYARNNFYFVKNYILGLKKAHLDEDNYVTSIYGPVRPRATGSV
jgi:hypothetical protein